MGGVPSKRRSSREYHRVFRSKRGVVDGSDRRCGKRTSRGREVLRDKRREEEKETKVLKKWDFALKGALHGGHRNLAEWAVANGAGPTLFKRFFGEACLSQNVDLIRWC